MNATPAFKDRESEFAQDVPVGTEVLGDWGAMYPTVRGEVVEVSHARTTARYLIRWNDGDMDWYQIRATRSPNGSPIGVWAR